MIFTLFALFLLSSSFASGKQTPHPVVALDSSKYVGHWLQVYEAPTNVLFQGFGKCITADYGILNNGDIDVVNTQINEKNEIEQIRGYAYYKNASEPGKLSVHLDGVPVDSPYWVVKLGEIKDNQYQYSIVTTPSFLSLWVLVRDLDTFFELYNDEVIEFLSQNGFKYTTVSQSDCNYEVSTPKESNNLRSNYQNECQISSYLQKSGFPGYTLGTMVCISKYESSFNCDATNKNTDGSTDYGLMQINSYYWCSGDSKSKYNECKNSCSNLFNCQANTNCAYTVWKQQGYTAWYGYQKHKTECDSYKLNC